MTPRRLEALRAMAKADESPHERDRARAILQRVGEPLGAPAEAPTFAYSTTTSGNVNVTVRNGSTITVRFRFGV